MAAWLSWLHHYGPNILLLDQKKNRLVPYYMYFATVAFSFLKQTALVAHVLQQARALATLPLSSRKLSKLA